MSRLDGGELKGVFDAIDTGLVVLDEDGRVLGWNVWMAFAAGIAAETALGRRLDELFPGITTPRLSAAVTEALTTGTSSLLTHSLHPGLLPLKTRAGRPMLHNVYVHPLKAQTHRALIQITDVTVATERDQVLRKRQDARYNAVVESAPDPILTLDTTATIRLANPAAAVEFGYEVPELVGQPIALLFEDQENWRTAWAAVVGGGSLGGPTELMARRKDGSLSFVEMSAAAWQTEAHVFVTAVLHDVNQRRAAEAALRSLNRNLELRVAERTADRDRMWRLSRDVMLVARLDGRINSTNPAWERLLGWDETTMQGAQLRDFVVTDDRPQLETALQRLTTEPATPLVIELRVRTRDGGSRWIAWSAVAEDDLLQAVGRDIQAEREAAQALLQAEEALRQSQKMEAIGQLTGGIAHDFNNLLTGIIGSMELLQQRLDAKQYDDVNRFIDAAVFSADRAASLTHRLLAFARHQPLNPIGFDLNRLIEDMADLLRRTLGEQVRLQFKLGKDVWSAMADANQLENAILNLAINARDAMPGGGVLTIETANIRLDETERPRSGEMEPGEYTIVCVGDTGTGMSRETIARVFDPFFTTKPIGQGTGLGLSMIYGFAKQSRGHVSIESEIGRGTKVSLYLPRYRGQSETPAKRGASAAPRGSGEEVLLVEDDPSVRLLIAEVLNDLDYHCIVADDSAAGAAILASDARLDLLITDIGLPGISGRELAEIGWRHRPTLKVLFVTGYADRAKLRGDLRDERSDLMTKPFSLETLAIKIREMIGS